MRSSILTSVWAMGPGEIIFDVTPRGPYSMATELERESMPALATETWVWKGMAR